MKCIISLMFKKRPSNNKSFFVSCFYRVYYKFFTRSMNHVSVKQIATIEKGKMLYSSCPPEMRDTLLHHTQETVKELTELSEIFEMNWASEWNLTILSLVLFNFGEKRQAMPVLIHTGPQGRKSLCDFPLCLLVEGSAPKPLWTQNFILWLRVLRTLLTRTSLPLAVVFFFFNILFYLHFQHPIHIGLCR